MVTRLSVLLVLLVLPALAAAQTVSPIVSYDLLVFASGVDPVLGIPAQTSTIPLTAVTCNLAPVTQPTTVTNPRWVYWDDENTVGKQCRADKASVFLALPVAPGYKAVVVANSAAGPSARSAASVPFAVASVPPAARTGVILTP